MGLFKRKPTTDLVATSTVNAISAQQHDIDALRVALADMNTRLDASEQVRRELESRIQSIDVTTLSLLNRTSGLDDLSRRVGEVDALKLQVAEVEVIKRQVAHLDAVNAKIASLDELNSKLSDLAERVTVSADDARQAKDQTATLHERISNVSHELANQLGELSREIDGLSGRGTAPTMPPPLPAPANFEPSQLVAEELVSQLRSSQIKLANEQARYEIAFRQDLAKLAEQVKRSIEAAAAAAAVDDDDL
jgi:DNA repair exonuclease SbcCD ATPase subunit